MSARYTSLLLVALLLCLLYVSVSSRSLTNGVVSVKKISSTDSSSSSPLSFARKNAKKLKNGNRPTWGEIRDGIKRIPSAVKATVVESTKNFVTSSGSLIPVGKSVGLSVSPKWYKVLVTKVNVCICV